MLNYDLRYDDGILVLKPEGPLQAQDFKTLARAVDAYLDGRGALRGVMIDAPGFPGWRNFGALVAHLKFVRQHHRQIEKVAVVSDSGVAAAIPHIANHFVHAQIKHFEAAQHGVAWTWLTRQDRARMRPAA